VTCNPKLILACGKTTNGNTLSVINYTT